MRDVELYRHLLGLSAPWTVARVELDLPEQRVDVYAEHEANKSWPCAECGAACGLYDHEPERRWRHLDSCQFQTFLHARIPRTKCPTHGVRQVRVPWAEPQARFTLLFERLAIDVLRETSIAGAAKVLGLSWEEAYHLMERAVARGLLRREQHVPRYLGIDEKSMGQGHRYATVVSDLEAGCVVEVAPDRKRQSLLECLGPFTPLQLRQVEAIAMDMWGPYLMTLEEVLPEADDKIVFDRFHIMIHVNLALDEVRRKENRLLKQEGDKRLLGTQRMWLYAEENLPERYQADFEALRDSNLKTARAWAIKESLRQLWHCPDHQAGEAWWRRWYQWATHSRLDPIKNLAAMLRRRLHNILTYFTHPITNAAAEGLNTTIQMLKQRAYGFRNFAHFRVAILFRCGGLQLHPAAHPLPG